MKKLGILILALVIALGSLGVGYARWSDNVTINGTVTSGNVCMKWSSWSNGDKCSGSLDPMYDPDNFDATWDKDVACTSVSFTDASHKTLQVTITNAYPGYYNDLQLDWINCGTIPIKLETLSIVPDNFTISHDMDWRNPDQTGEIYLEWTALNVVTAHHQYEPGEKGTTSLIILIDQSAVQGMTYTFTITLVGSQWNEVY